MIGVLMGQAEDWGGRAKCVGGPMGRTEAH